MRGDALALGPRIAVSDLAQPYTVVTGATTDIFLF